MQHATQRKDVGALVGLLAAHLLGRHVPHRAHDRSLIGERRPRRSGGVRIGPGAPAVRGQAEIQHLQLPLAGDEQVVRLDVPVNDAPPVGRTQGLGGLARKRHRLPWRQRAVGQPLPQRRPLEQLHGGVHAPVRGAEIVDRQDVRVGESSHRLRLALKALQHRRVFPDLGGQHLHRDVAVELRIAGAVHLAHPTRADQLADLVSAQPGPDVQCHDPDFTSTRAATAKREMGSGRLPSFGQLRLGELRVPGHVDTALHGLIGRAAVGVDVERPLDDILLPGWHPDVIVHPDLRDAKHALNVFDVAFDFGSEVLGRDYPARIQRATQGAGQSTGNGGDHVVERRRMLCGRHLLAVLVLIERLDAAVDTEVEGLVEALDPGGAMRPGVLSYLDAARVNDVSHGWSPFGPVGPMLASVLCRSSRFRTASVAPLSTALRSRNRPESAVDFLWKLGPDRVSTGAPSGREGWVCQLGMYRVASPSLNQEPTRTSRRCISCAHSAEPRIMARHTEG